MKEMSMLERGDRKQGRKPEYGFRDKNEKLISTNSINTKA